MEANNESFDKPTTPRVTSALAKAAKVDKTGQMYYGDKFTVYQRIGEYKDLIPAYKDFYYERRIKDPKYGLVMSIQDFNEQVAYPRGLKLHPYTQQIRAWVRKWNADIIRQQFNMKEDGEITPEKQIRQVVKTRNNELGLLAPSDSDLEAGTRTLGGELLNDAMQMLHDDQELEEIYEDDTLIKRRSYVLNVFAHATRLVHGKAALMLKASEEKRNNASFLMTLLAKATAGKLTDEEVQVLKAAPLAPVETVQGEVVQTQTV